MFESAISTSLLLGGRFGVLTTGQAMVPGIVKGINAFGSSTRCSGVYATDLGVAELHDSRGANRSKVERVMKETAAKMVREGADVIILGCAGMVGMEKLVKDGVKEAGLEKQIWVVDGAKSGIELLAALIRVKRQA
jgi:Asp/Glu/hydantoin racemase